MRKKFVVRPFVSRGWKPVGRWTVRAWSGHGESYRSKENVCLTPEEARTRMQIAIQSGWQNAMMTEVI